MCSCWIFNSELTNWQLRQQTAEAQTVFKMLYEALVSAPYRADQKATLFTA